MGSYLRYLCPVCKKEHAISPTPLGYNVGEPLIECSCGTKMDMRDTQNEWLLMALTEKIGFVLQALFMGVMYGLLFASLIVAIIDGGLGIKLESISFRWLLAGLFIPTFGYYLFRKKKLVNASKLRTMDKSYVDMLNRSLKKKGFYWGGLIKENTRNQKWSQYNFITWCKRFKK